MAPLLVGARTVRVLLCGLESEGGLEFRRNDFVSIVLSRTCVFSDQVYAGDQEDPRERTAEGPLRDVRRGPVTG